MDRLTGNKNQDFFKAISKELLYILVSLMLGISTILTIEYSMESTNQYLILAKNFLAGAMTSLSYLGFKYLEKSL